jgi:hypothetical protein
VTIEADDTDPELVARFERCVSRTLLSAGWARRRSMWARACVTILPDTAPHVRLRDELAAWLRANDLAELAEECRRHRVGAGEVLVFVLRDDAEASFTGFHTMRVRA